MAKDTQVLIDAVSTWALNTGGRPAAAGFVCAAAGIALVTATSGIPDPVRNFFQIGCLALFLFGILTVAKRTWVVGWKPARKRPLKSDAHQP